MIGFELIKGNNTFSAVIKNGVSSIIVDRIIRDNRNYLEVNFGGYDVKNNTYPRWYRKKLYLGDKFLVKVKEITENSPEITQENDQEDYFDHNPSIGIELSLKGEVISAVISKGSIHLITTIINNGTKNEIDLDFVAKDFISNEVKSKKYWYRNTLQLGDEFSIEIKEMEKMTLPLETE